MDCALFFVALSSFQFLCSKAFRKVLLWPIGRSIQKLLFLEARFSFGNRSTILLTKVSQGSRRAKLYLRWMETATRSTVQKKANLTIIEASYGFVYAWITITIKPGKMFRERIVSNILVAAQRVSEAQCHRSKDVKLEKANSAWDELVFREIKFIWFSIDGRPTRASYAFWVLAFTGEIAIRVLEILL